MSESKRTWDDVMQEYIETFKRLGIFYEEPGGIVPLLNDYEGEVCYTLEGETPDTVHDRIERSKKAGENLFFKECKVYEIKYKSGVQY